MPTKIAIDGFAGTGKSTVARVVAESLGIPYFNTDQLHRAVAYELVRDRGGDPHDEKLATLIAEGLHPIIGAGTVVESNRINMRGKLDADDISTAALAVAKHSGVRQALVKVQQDYAARYGAIIEGCDIGTVIMPDADPKVFLTCDPGERVRRWIKAGNLGTAVERLARYRQDSEQTTVPLIKAEGAMEIDTTHLTIDQVVKKITDEIYAKRQRNRLVTGRANKKSQSIV
jgi:cytidylate kinase